MLSSGTYQNRHIGDLAEHTGLRFRKVANSRYGVPLNNFLYSGYAVLKCRVS
jgi:hypothetical protein